MKQIVIYYLLGEIKKAYIVHKEMISSLKAGDNASY